VKTHHTEYLGQFNLMAKVCVSKRRIVFCDLTGKLIGSSSFNIGMCICVSVAKKADIIKWPVRETVNRCVVLKQFTWIVRYWSLWQLLFYFSGL